MVRLDCTTKASNISNALEYQYTLLFVLPSSPH
ncbi:hypothetical protein PMIN01_11122 [Paraphaeosphaeria minitans]|uniref:Uncharacterized protein n=1 Tax=Paraphaeosphaeria minitans TaxID=565426 RepID=A0A9P6G9G4_9PLEO|nr:hypothetical protein PMIN01_11122 [Paraphaeosphaeria minitans]